MRQSIQHRLIKLEAGSAPGLLLEVSLPNGRKKVMSAAEYQEQPIPLDFRVVSGENAFDAGCIGSYILNAGIEGQREPTIDPGGCKYMAGQLGLLAAILHPLPNRQIPDEFVEPDPEPAPDDYPEQPQLPNGDDADVWPDYLPAAIQHNLV